MLVHGQFFKPTVHVRLLILVIIIIVLIIVGIRIVSRYKLMQRYGLGIAAAQVAEEDLLT